MLPGCALKEQRTSREAVFPMPTLFESTLHVPVELHHESRCQATLFQDDVSRGEEYLFAIRSPSDLATVAIIARKRFPVGGIC